MTKIQKVWLWGSLAMFLMPEILFSITSSMVLFFYGRSFSSLNSILVNYGLFFDHPVFLLIIILVECIGVINLLVLSFKFNKNILAYFLIAFLLWLVVIVVMVYVTGISMGW